MKNKFLLASVMFLSVGSLFACTSPKKESSKSSSASSSRMWQKKQQNQVAR